MISKEKAKEYHHQWYLRNKDKVRASDAKWKAKHWQEYYLANRESLIANAKKYQATSKERARASYERVKKLYPEKLRARELAKKKIPLSPCEKCGQ